MTTAQKKQIELIQAEYYGAYIENVTYGKCGEDLITVVYDGDYFVTIDRDGDIVNEGRLDD